VRTGRRTSGFLSHDLGSAPRLPQRRQGHSARWVPGLGLDQAQPLCPDEVRHGPARSWWRRHARARALCRDAAGLTSVPTGLPPAFAPWFRVCPCLCIAEGSSLPVSPFPLTPALRGAILPMFLSQALDVFRADAKLLPQDPLIHPHGGLTPRLAFFSQLLITLAVLAWAGALRAVLRWPPISTAGRGAGCTRTPGSLLQHEG